MKALNFDTNLEGIEHPYIYIFVYWNFISVQNKKINNHR